MNGYINKTGEFIDIKNISYNIEFTDEDGNFCNGDFSDEELTILPDESSINDSVSNLIKKSDRENTPMLILYQDKEGNFMSKRWGDEKIVTYLMFNEISNDVDSEIHDVFFEDK
jgi:hypothetical protein